MAYVTVEHQLDVKVRCSACGNSLDIGDLDFSNGDVELTVSPCEACLDEAKKEGADLANLDEPSTQESEDV